MWPVAGTVKGQHAGTLVANSNMPSIVVLTSGQRVDMGMELRGVAGRVGGVASARESSKSKAAGSLLLF